jgi:cob(I)alamin adenosyltransferase
MTTRAIPVADRHRLRSELASDSSLTGAAMGNRLSKIYTKTGDDGTTGLGDGTRVAKDSARVAAYGTVDELNSTIGVVLAQDVPANVREVLTQVQHDLFDLGGELCIPGMAMIHDADVERLEGTLDAFNEDLPPLKDFILPGGSPAAANAHVARTVCRRAERATVTLSKHEAVRPEAVRYLNRLSDLLFVLARVLARASGHGEVLWQHERRKRPKS